MFDTTEIGKRIKQARIDQNMTQMALADVMGVSYQAVSNWERGNSMPDISKLGDLCNALNLTVNALLGLEESKPNAVTKAMENETLTMEELAEVAPVLPPKTVREEAVKITVNGYTLDELKSGDKGIKVSVHKAGEKKGKKLDLSRIVELAPFLDAQYLDELVRKADISDLEGLDEIAPFLSSETLDYVAEQMDISDFDELEDIVPFLSASSLEKLVRRCEDAGEFDTIVELAPFLSEKTLDELVDRYVEQNRKEDLEDLYPFLGRSTLRRLASYMMERRDMDSLEDLMPFI